MHDNDRCVYSPKVRRRLDSLEAKKHALELKVRDVDRQIQELLVGQSTIGPGDRIKWLAANRERYGRVIAVRTAYRGFEYRVEITTKDGGRVIGQATVGESDQPTLLHGGSGDG
jgi:hypothetical protein